MRLRGRSRPRDIVPIEYHVSADEGDDVTYRSQGSRYSDRHQWWYFPDVTIDEMIVFIGFDSARPDSPNTLHVAFEDTDGARSGATLERRDPLLRAVRLSRLGRTRRSRRGSARPGSPTVRRRAGNHLDPAVRGSDGGPGPGREQRTRSIGCPHRARSGAGGAARHRRARRARARRRRPGARPRFRRRRDGLPRRPPRCWRTAWKSSSARAMSVTAIV